MLQVLSAEEFSSLFPRPGVAYNSVAFAELNREKVEQVHYLTIGADADRPDFGIILGQTGDRLLSPFSAPFGGFEAVHTPGVGKWIEAVETIKNFAIEKECRLRISLPPSFYYPDDRIAHQSLAFATAGFRNTPDYNYHIPVEGRKLTGSGRNKLKNAQAFPFRFEKTLDVARAYSIIKANREEQGYPLRMSLRQVEETTRIIKADLFILSLDSIDVAAAQIFHVNDRVVQVIYWGDIREFSKYRPMNYLANAVAEHYAAQGKIVDVGPSSSDGIPSPGLCDFKKNIGCLLNPKNVFTFSPS